MNKIAVGCMSGTSLDGLSLIAASFNEKKKSFQLLSYKTVPYPIGFRESLLKSPHLTVSEVSRLHFQLGSFYAESVQSFIKKNKIPSGKIAVIGSHGQTIYHEPLGNPPNTFQIGETSFIAEITGIPVVSDFRPRAIAAGGEGAPLVPYFDHFFYGVGPVSAFQNIGGIGNVTVVGKGIKQSLFFDTGPGNCLMDWLVQKSTKGHLSFDREGRSAARGKIWMDIVQELADHPYFSRKPPKSTGKELFNENFIPQKYRRRFLENLEDGLATLTYFTATTIYQSYKKFIFPKYSLRQIVVSGGGALNGTLMENLRKLFKEIPVISIEELGVPAQAKEPLAFAFFALRALEGKENYPGAILGKITR